MRYRHWILTALLLALLFNVKSQVRIEGRIIDALTNKPVYDASITILGSSAGTVAAKDGSFSLQTNLSDGTLQITHVSYKNLAINFKTKNQDLINLGTLVLEPKSYTLGTTDIRAFRAEEGKSPLNVRNISQREIRQYNTGLSYPELMRNIPGIYASGLGGGVGDAAINIRGFKQENLALTLNGIPIGSVENGLVYWSNWDGLQEATQSLQVQKGMGSAELAFNALGGTINISTHAPATEEGGQISYYTTDYGLQRTSLSLSTGNLSNGWRFSFVGSRTVGKGYADGTQVNTWSYFLFGEKVFNARHRIIVSLIGSPDRHGQRASKLSFNDIKSRGIRYNPDWGTYYGRAINLQENFYHKPLLSISHYWTLDEKSQLATSLYASYGSGGGRWAENFSGAPVFAYRTLSGQIDWDALALANSTHNDIYITSSNDTLRNFSLNARTLFLASHYWAGILSVYSHNFSKSFNLKIGLHGRHFKSWLWEEIDDLMGGNFFIDDYAWAIEGRAGRNILKYRGDKVRIDNGAIVDLAASFARLEYTSGKLAANLSAGANYNGYQREDRYNYPSHPASEKIYRLGWETKGGIVYQVSRVIKAYATGGFITRAPYHKFVFPNYNNNPAHDLRNEKIASMDVGLGGKLGSFSYNLNFYNIRWDDKSLLSNEYLLIDNRTTTRAMVSGLGALHRGLEAELSFEDPKLGLVLGSHLSLGNWKWKNNVRALLFNNENQLIDTVEVYADGLYVGDAPQLQAGLYLNKSLTGGITLFTSYSWNDRFYADFDPSTRTRPGEGQPYKIPAFGLWDARLNYKTQVLGKPADFALACSNILNKEYIMRGEDGAMHNQESFRGYWGPGRSFHLFLRLSL
ncbi:MAG: TonB-dependent receptor [Bacteroidales bacterium]